MNKREEMRGKGDDNEKGGGRYTTMTPTPCL